MELKNSIAVAAAMAILLNLSGAIISKYLALNLDDLMRIILLGGILAGVYAGRLKFWVWAGKHFQLSYLYPFISLSYVISLGFGYFLFAEEVTPQKIIGSLLIVSGVFAVSKSTHQKEET